MPVYKGMTELPSTLKNAVVTIGNFDGVHCGHQELLRRVHAHSQRIQGVAVAITFRPHPYFVIRATSEPYLLNSYEERAELLSQYGMEVIVEQPFSREFSNTRPEEFVDNFLVRALATKVLYLGYDFAFGKERTGSVDVLKQLAENRGIEIHVVEPFRVDGQAVSSSLVRKALSEGEIPLVNECLGRTFFLRGLVWRGEGRGRTIGVPTANLQTENRRYPKVGVYATRTLWRGTWYNSISNIGYNPTFKGDGTDLPLKVETHLFDFDSDMYGDEIQVNFYAFLRPEKKFAGVQELLSQIKEDSARAREVLAGIS